MNKYYGVVAAVVVVIVIVIGGLYMTLPEDKGVQIASDQIIFFYGDTCPHCKNVEEYVTQNAVHEKVQFEEREVYNNRENSKELNAIAKKCGIEADQVGVPLLWTGEKCLVGDKDIISFFAEKIGGDVSTE